MTHYKTTILWSLCLVCLLGAVMLPASAASINGTSYRDSPEHIAAMKAYVAYAGEKTEARIDGAIGYIGTLSSGAGTDRLSATRSQYTDIVSSVQGMNRYEQIHNAETQMRTAGTDFTSAARTEVKQYNGTEKALAAAVNASVTAQAGTIASLENAWWTARATARMNEFAANDARRTATIANLTAKGVDVTQAQSLESQIKEAGAALSAALNSHDEKAVKTANEQLAVLDKQFAEIVKGYHAAKVKKAKATPAVTGTPATV